MCKQEGFLSTDRAMTSSRRCSVALLRSFWPSSAPNRTSTVCTFLRPFFSSPFPSPCSSSFHPSPLPPPASSVATSTLCGRGDKKTKKGKRFRGKFGNSRPNREHRIRRIRERWEQPPGTPWPVPGLSVEDYRPIV